MADKTLYPLQIAMRSAERVISYIQLACQDYGIAGSLRRGIEQVHDLDLVVWPIVEWMPAVDGKPTGLFEAGDTVQWPESLLKTLSRHGLCSYQKPTNKGYPRILKLTGENLPIEIYLTDPDGSNFGALYQMRTGSAEFNIELAIRAQKRGLRYRAGYGIFDPSGKRVDNPGPSENSIFEVLGLPFIPPEKREGLSR